MTPFRLAHISRFIFMTASVTIEKRSICVGEYVMRTSIPSAVFAQLPGPPFIPGKYFFRACEPSTMYARARGRGGPIMTGAVSAVLPIAVTIFAIISMPAGDSGLS